jgi:hypothetical protein
MLKNSSSWAARYFDPKLHRSTAPSRDRIAEFVLSDCSVAFSRQARGLAAGTGQPKSRNSQASARLLSKTESLIEFLSGDGEPAN